jgi:hypothetical protein
LGYDFVLLVFWLIFRQDYFGNTTYDVISVEPFTEKETYSVILSFCNRIDLVVKNKCERLILKLGNLSVNQDDEEWVGWNHGIFSQFHILSNDHFQQVSRKTINQLSRYMKTAILAFRASGSLVKQLSIFTAIPQQESLAALKKAAPTLFTLIILNRWIFVSAASSTIGKILLAGILPH